MKKTKLLSSETYYSFWAKVLLFLFFLSFTISASAHQIAFRPGDADNKGPEDLTASLPLSSKVETAKIYLSEGVAFFNDQEINANREIVPKEKIVKTGRKKANLQLEKTKPKKTFVAKSKIKEAGYASKFRFRKLRFESRNTFLGRGAKIETIPSIKPSLKLVGVAVQNHIYFFIPLQYKHISKYITPFANEISHWQMDIRPPPLFRNRTNINILCSIVRQYFDFKTNECLNFLLNS